MKKKLSKEQIHQRHVSRRQFLYGAGSALMLPTLVSMMPEAVAQAAATEKKLRLCLLPTQYGMFTEHLLGNAMNHPSWQQIQDAPRIRHGQLSQISGNISYVVDSKLDPYRNDMNLYSGLDLMSPYGHNWGGFTGSTGGRLLSYGRSIDVIIENSEAFKKSFKGKVATIRQHNYYHAGGFSFDRKRDAKGNFLPGEANCVEMYHETGDGNMFRLLFGSTTPTTGNDLGITRRQLLVDKVLDDYKSLKNNRRISGSDKSLLDQFINGLFEVQSNIQSPAATLSCTSSPKGYVDQKLKDPGEIGNWNQYWKNVFSMVVASFACDQSRMYCGHYYPYDPRHHDIDNSAAEYYGSKHQKDWINLMVDHLIKPMKELQDPFGGGSLLDNSLVVWHNEHSGRGGHGHSGVPVMSFGNLGGKVRSGYVMDYGQYHTKDVNGRPRRGFPMKMMLVSILEAMGVTRTEILRESGEGGGFGSWPEFLAFNSDNKPTLYIKDLYDLSYFSTRHSNALPFFTKA